MLIVPVQQVTPFDSIETANIQRAKLCMEAGSYAASVVQTMYPLINTVSIAGSAAEVLGGIEAGLCDGVVLATCDWQVAQVQKTVNPSCTLAAIGPTFVTVNGAWPYLVDFNQKCTSIVETVLSEIIVDMALDGTLDLIVQKSLNPINTAKCPVLAAPLVPPPPQFGIHATGGIFIIYAIFATVALIWYQMLCLIKRMGYWYPLKNSLRRSGFWPPSKDHDSEDDEVEEERGERGEGGEGGEGDNSDSGKVRSFGAGSPEEGEAAHGPGGGGGRGHQAGSRGHQAGSRGHRADYDEDDVLDVSLEFSDHQQDSRIIADSHRHTYTRDNRNNAPDLSQIEPMAYSGPRDTPEW